MNGQEQAQQQMVMLAAIGDLEIARRQLIMEIQARDARIAELERELMNREEEEVAVDTQAAS
jgi:hypothetical protein